MRRTAIVEVLDRDGYPRLIVPVTEWPVTIGRAIDCDVVLDDAHVAPVHVTLTESDSLLHLTVGDSINGVRVRGRILSRGDRAELPAGEMIQIGGTRVRVRRAADGLPPERPLVDEASAGWKPVLGLTLATAVWGAGTFWVNADPGARVTAYLPVLLGLPIITAVWCSLWAVGSKLVRHRFQFLAHARIALGYMLASSVIAPMLSLLSFAVGFELLGRVSGIVEGAIVCAMILAHLTLVLPAHRRLLVSVVTVVFVGGVALTLVRNYQTSDRLFGQLYMATLAPPALRLAPAVTTARFIEEARSLKATVDAHIGDDDREASWADQAFE